MRALENVSLPLRPSELLPADLSGIRGRVVCLAPHPDDEALGCGGFLAALAEAGVAVEVVFVTSGANDAHDAPDGRKSSRVQSAALSTGFLGVKKYRFLSGLNGRVTHFNLDLVVELAKALREEIPTLIMLPHPGERNPDHRGLSPCLAMALSKFYLPAARLPRVMFYEVWTPIQHGQIIFDISPYLEKKLAAVDSYEASVLGHLKEALKGLNRYRGISMLDRDCHAELFRELQLDEFLQLAAQVIF
jgi:LmbE family N-acetylglucosaminyl deacetylase